MKSVGVKIRTENLKRPRALAHRGFVEASGFWLDVELVGLAEARRRILALWQPGMQVFRVAGGLCVLWPSPQRIACAHSPGVPLVAAGKALLAAPLAADELKALDPAPDSVVLIRGGRAVVEPLSHTQLEAPEQWLAVDGFITVKPESLGRQPEQPRIVVEPQAFNARDRMEGVPPAAAEMAEVLNALVGRAKAKSGAGGRASAGEGAGLLNRLKSGAAAFASVLKSFFARTGQPGSGNAGGMSGRPAGLPLPARPSLLHRFSARARQLFARMLITTRLAGFIGRRQAEYIGRMMELFERGDLTEALKYAIPLGGEAESALKSLALSVPTPRASLSISPAGTPARSSIGMGGDLLAHLRQLYRASFERLAAQGRIEEAAFVLLELLHENHEAIAFLERHGRLRLAAEIAEARELPPGLVIRQWFVAGDRKRAVLMARRTGAFADAVVRLEKSDPKQAEVLRLLWAGTLAEAGDYAAAVEVAWPVAEAHRLAVTWMDRAIENGGAVAGRMLARKLTEFPEAFAEVRGRVGELLEDESCEVVPARAAFAETLVRGEQSPQAQTMARATARAILRDAGRGHTAMNQSQFSQLVLFAGDGALRADIPSLPKITSESLSSRAEPMRIEIAASDAGTLPVNDIALLPSGRLVAAFGEAGVKLLARDGRTITHFDQPAHRLVISDHGDRAIVMARRGEVWRLARLNLLARSSEDWCEARIDAFAADYDGSAWFIGAGGEGWNGDFYAIDVTAKRFDALWRVPAVEGQVYAVARSSSRCRFLTTEAFAVDTEAWDYELPSLTLRGRERLNHEFPKDCLMMGWHLMISPEGKVIEAVHPATFIRTEVAQIAGIGEDHGWRLRFYADRTNGRELLVGGEGETMGAPAICGNWIAATVTDAAGTRVLLIETSTGKEKAVINLSGSQNVCLRPQSETLTMADDRGRILVLQLSDGQLLRNLRL
ncbi:MAG TPA: bpX6 domain-containing protein [Blastocatellia bacterium]|nr:bpX6 domain-containing protein [Blastocatellia bacterium]